MGTDARRFCVCGFSFKSDEPREHDHEARLRENAIRDAHLVGDAAFEADLRERGAR